MKISLSTVKLAIFTIMLTGAAFAQGDTKSGGTVAVPESGSSVILLGIAATAILLVARHRFKK